MGSLASIFAMLIAEMGVQWYFTSLIFVISGATSKTVFLTTFNNTVPTFVTILDELFRVMIRLLANGLLVSAISGIIIPRL